MSPADGESDLLLGLLALRSGLIDRPTLAQALADWRRDPSRSLQQHLVERGSLTTEELALLVDLRRRALARFANQPDRTLTAIDATDPILVELQQDTVDSLAATIATPPFPPPVPSTLPGSTEALPRERFRLKRLHARGGLGEVFLAHDDALDRDVALKQIRSEHADHPNYRADFLREAHLTGLLEHPGVVPVYGLGTHPDGRPFYAMRFIEGETLRAAVGRFHSPGLPDAQRRVALRELLRRFIEVCNTLAFAHSRAIIHRDLKPDNVMLGKYGETLVVDWGLARRVGQQDGAASPAVVAEGAGTVAGQVKGTPAYMAPEQAEGRADLGPACDVYGLGATLFFLLTGLPPVEESSIHLTLFQVQRGQIRRPRDLKRDVPPGLEAVCLKALALTPEDRYASAADLAQDIARWLADEPPLAYKEPVGERLTRLARRYRSATAALGLALVGITLASVLALFFVNRARQAEARAYAINTVRDLTDGVQPARWNDEHLARLDFQLAELGRLDPGALPAARERVAEALAEAIRAGLHLPTLPDEVRQRVASQLRALRERDPDRAGALQGEFAQRLRDWEPLFDLSAPFRNLGEVFDPGRVHVAGTTLLAVPIDPAPDGPPVVATLAPSAGNMQLEAVFDPSWASAPVVGLILQAGPTGAYEFHVSSFDYSATAALDLARRDPLATALKARERVGVSISRDGVVLARTQLPLQAGPLRLRVERVGDRVSFQVNDLPNLVFQDLFAPTPPADAPFAIVWPAGVKLTALHGRRQALPLAPSPLEKGDDLFGKQNYDAALAFYREQVRIAEDPGSAAPARFKAALCLYELGRKDEAIEALRPLRRETSDAMSRWRVQAIARLWLWALLAGQTLEAETLFAELPPDLSVDVLAGQIPAQLRKDAINELRLRGPRWHSVWESKRQLTVMKRAVQLETRLNESAYERRLSSWKLIDLYRAVGQMDVALLRMRELLGERDIPADERVAYLRDLTWMQIETGRIDEALAGIDQELKDHSAPEYLTLLLERARLLGAQKKWAQAEKAVDGYLEKFKPGEGVYADYADACLLKGFLRREQGDEAGAKEAWRRGLLRDWPGGLPALPRGRLPSGVIEHQYTSGNTFNFLLSSLVGDMTEREAETYLTSLTTGQGVSRQVVQVLSKQNFPMEFVRQVMLGNCAEPRGQEIARRMVFRQIDFRGFYIDPFRQSIAVAFRLGAINRKLTEEEDAVLWTGVDKFFKAFDAGRLDADAFRDLFQLWLGRAGEDPAETWARVASTLEPDLRTPGAYLLGMRYVFLKRPRDARPFLHEAASDKSPEFKLERRLAEEELRKLGP
jgi:tetratricopeptide (TPR) repeat protein/tRNA A-37 threonylcarbamoyl transferase component Bud32